MLHFCLLVVCFSWVKPLELPLVQLMYSTDELYAQNIDVITQATFTQTVIHACASA